MTEADDVEAFQAEVAWTALAAISGQGFALAGAGALIAHGLVDRPTQDLDLFSPLPRPARSPPSCSRLCGKLASRSPSTARAPSRAATSPAARGHPR